MIHRNLLLVGVVFALLGLGLYFGCSGDGSDCNAIQTPGDCRKVVCDADGNAKNVDDPTDLPTSATACLTAPTCSGSPLAPHFTDAATDTDCSSDNQLPKQVCGPPGTAYAGTCVECNHNYNCSIDADGGFGTCQGDHTCAY